MATTAKRPSRRGSGGPGVSLERALSKLGLASRSEARKLIAGGRVAIDGTAVVNPGLRVIPERITITIDGESRAAASEFTLILHKPRGYVTTRSDPDGRKTVFDLLTDVPTRVVPVGRLDLATSGLLIFTSDTQLSHWLTDPESAIPRVYLVTVKGRVQPETAALLRRGVVVDGDRLVAADASVRKASTRESHLVITLEEGKNREVRRLMEAVGHPVTQLRRVQFGGLDLGSLAPGQWREVSAAELRSAFPGYQPRRRAPKPK